MSDALSACWLSVTGSIGKAGLLNKSDRAGHFLRPCRSEGRKILQVYTFGYLSAHCSEELETCEPDATLYHCGAGCTLLRITLSYEAYTLEACVRSSSDEDHTQRPEAFTVKADDCTGFECIQPCNRILGPATATGSACVALEQLRGKDMTSTRIKFSVASAQSLLRHYHGEMCLCRPTYEILSESQPMFGAYKFINSRASRATLTVRQPLRHGGNVCFPVLNLPISCRIRWCWYLVYELAKHPTLGQTPCLQCAFVPSIRHRSTRDRSSSRSVATLCCFQKPVQRRGSKNSNHGR